MAKDKQYRDNAQKFDRDHLHSDEEAIGIIKSLGTKKFDETVDIVVRLGVDPRKADQMIRGTVALPAGTGKDVRVRCSPRAKPPRPLVKPVRSSSAPTISPPRSRAA